MELGEDGEGGRVGGGCLFVGVSGHNVDVCVVVWYLFLPHSLYLLGFLNREFNTSVCLWQIEDRRLCLHAFLTRLFHHKIARTKTSDQEGNQNDVLSFALGYFESSRPFLLELKIEEVEVLLLVFEDAGERHNDNQFTHLYFHL